MYSRTIAITEQEKTLPLRKLHMCSIWQVHLSLSVTIHTAGHMHPAGIWAWLGFVRVSSGVAMCTAGRVMITIDTVYMAVHVYCV